MGFGYDGTMLVPFYTGWLFLFLAFAAAAAETLARGLPIETQALLSAKQLWHSLWPGNYVLTQVRIERVLPWLWDPILLTLLAVPGWALFGVPGSLLAWFFRPGRHMTEEEQRDLEKMRETLFLFDELAAEARRQSDEDGENPDEDDTQPSHSGHAMLEEAEDMALAVDLDFLRQYELDLRADDAPPVIMLGEERAAPMPPDVPPSNDNRGG